MRWLKVALQAVVLGTIAMAVFIASEENPTAGEAVGAVASAITWAGFVVAFLVAFELGSASSRKHQLLCLGIGVGLLAICIATSRPLGSPLVEILLLRSDFAHYLAASYGILLGAIASFGISLVRRKVATSTLGDSE